MDLTKDNKPDGATAKYTEFLLTTASGNGVFKEHEKGTKGTTIDKKKISLLRQ